MARSICARCPVRKPCLVFALGGDTELVTGEPQTEAGLDRPSQLPGIWGGTNEVERRALRQQLRSGRSIVEVVESAPVPSAGRHPSLRATA